MNQTAFTSYRIHITPLSPIHIGSGESYEPTNYVIEDEILHEFDMGSVAEALTAGDRKILLGIASRRPDGEMIKGVQRYFYERRQQLIPWAVRRIPVLPSVAAFYASRVGQTANREAGGRQVLNRLEIDRTSYNPITRLPVLFGSSLKGAIRTALLDTENDAGVLQTVQDQYTGRKRKEKNLELQQRLFQYRAGKFELDPMRLVQIADASWHGEPGLPATEVHLAVNRKKSLVVDEQGKPRKSQAETRDLYQILECISGWRYRSFSGQLNLQCVDGLSELSRKGERQIPAAGVQFKMEDIARACNAFYMPILQSEIRLLHGRGLLDGDWEKTIAQLTAASEGRMQRGEVFMLRAGRHSGAESVTLRGVREIKIMQGKDLATRQDRSTTDSEARTLWLAADRKDQTDRLLPFGWLLVEVAPVDVPINDWPELEMACEPHLTSARAFAQRLADEQMRQEEARAAVEARHRAQEEQARLAAQAEKEKQRQEAEAKAAIAQLDPVERSIIEFLDARVDKNQSEISAVIGGVKQGRWEREEKRVVARWLEARMRADKEWKPQSKAKKPEKDREHQNTLLVMAWLEEN